MPLLEGTPDLALKLRIDPSVVVFSTGKKLNISVRFFKSYITLRDGFDE